MKGFSLTCCMLLGALAAAHATVYYVDGSKFSNAGTGTSWTTAKRDVQAAINAASLAGDEVWVKAGTYYPTEDLNGNAAPADGRDKAFYIKLVDIKLYGGFAGTELSASARNPVANPTILSGDLNVGSNAAADCYHVLVLLFRTATCAIDGFTIRDGKATGSTTVSVAPSFQNIGRSTGGGLKTHSSSASISRCTFTANAGGSTMDNTGGAPTVSSCTFSSNGCIAISSVTNCAITVSDCSFSGNSGNLSNGAAISTGYNSSLTATNCTFTGNSTSGWGGALYNSGTAASIINCTFTSNAAGGGGGAIHNFGCNAVVSGCVFISDSSVNGGGAINNSDCNPTVTDCIFLNNSAISHYGGGIFNSGIGSATVNRCIFTGNRANYGGGMANIATGGAVVTNCVFSANTATYSGGGVGNYGAGGNLYPLMAARNCTFYNNKVSAANGLGAGLYYGYLCGGTAANCILWGNATPANPADSNQENLFGEASSPVPLTVGNCLIHDYSAAAALNYTATNILTADPRFVDAADADGPDNLWKTADDGLALQSCSPAINTGTTPSPVAPTDLRGNTRVGAYDLGAYEYQAAAATPQLAAVSTTAAATQYAFATVAYGDCNGTVATIKSGNTMTALRGAVTASVYVQATTPIASSQPYVRRTYDIAPATDAATATALVTLYFTQADFTDYNSSRGTYPSLPVDAADLQNYKANLRITQQHGTSATGAPGTFAGWTGAGPGTVLIEPTAVVWNAALVRWEVTLPVTGFSGFFAHSGSAALLQLRPVPVGGGTVTLAPQPAAGSLTVANTEASLNGSTATVLDIQGREVARFILAPSVTLEVSGWGPGLYALRLASGEVLRVVKQ